MEDKLRQIEKIVDEELKTAKEILSIIEGELPVSYVSSVNSVDIYALFKKNYDKFSEFPGNDIDDKWKKNRSKPAFIKLSNSIF